MSVDSGERRGEFGNCGELGFYWDCAVDDMVGSILKNMC